MGLNAADILQILRARIIFDSGFDIECQTPKELDGLRDLVNMFTSI